MSFSEKLQISVDAAIRAFNKIPEARKLVLQDLAQSVRSLLQKRGEANLIFICTHNSRRSHMGELWARAATFYYGLEGIHCYSGGTEATSFNHRSVNALRESGMEITSPDPSENPVYEVRIGSDKPVMNSFSKIFSDPFNPSENFIAIMVCSDADEACPFVPGAEYRYSIPYTDPKISDGSPDEERVYYERSKQIASEMFYIISQV